MGRALDISLPSDGERQHNGVKGIYVKERIEAILIEQQEAYQHEPASQKMGDIECQTVHLEAPRYEQQQRA
jgi:hypothetical protein